MHTLPDNSCVRDYDRSRKATNTDFETPDSNRTLLKIKQKRCSVVIWWRAKGLRYLLIQTTQKFVVSFVVRQVGWRGGRRCKIRPIQREETMITYIHSVNKRIDLLAFPVFIFASWLTRARSLARDLKQWALEQWHMPRLQCRLETSLGLSFFPMCTHGWILTRAYKFYILYTRRTFTVSIDWLSFN